MRPFPSCLPAHTGLKKRATVGLLLCVVIRKRATVSSCLPAKITGRCCCSGSRHHSCGLSPYLRSGSRRTKACRPRGAVAGAPALTALARALVALARALVALARSLVALARALALRNRADVVRLRCHVARCKCSPSECCSCYEYRLEVKWLRIHINLYIYIGGRQKVNITIERRVSQKVI
jgi:hypothetical protein